MNKKLLLFVVLLCSIIFALSACTGEKENESNEIKNSESNESESGNSSVQGSQTLNVVTISYMGSHIGINDYMQEKIRDAMLEIYPNYELNLTTFKDKDSYNTSVQLSLMSGQPYDLMCVDQVQDYLKIDKFVENDYFKDIYELIENDKSVSIDDYYVNALKAYELNGKLYRMPLNFVYNNFIGINANASQESIDKFKKLDRISANTMLDIFKQNKDDYNLALTTNALGHSELIEPSMTSYINYENKACDFDNDRFKNFLTDVRDFLYSTDGYLVYHDNSVARSFYTREDDTADSTKSLFSFRHYYNMGQSLVEYAEPYFEHLIPMTNESGEMLISSKAVYAIGNTANAQMAWDFLKFFTKVFNEDIYTFETSQATIPIRKDLFLNKATMFMSTAFDESSGTGGYVGYGYGGDLMYDKDTTVSRGIEKLEKYIEMPMINVQEIDTDGSIYRKTINDFMKGLTTVDQAAEQIQNAMSLYLSE